MRQHPASVKLNGPYGWYISRETHNSFEYLGKDGKWWPSMTIDSDSAEHGTYFATKSKAATFLKSHKEEA